MLLGLHVLQDKITHIFVKRGTQKTIHLNENVGIFLWLNEQDMRANKLANKFFKSGCKNYKIGSLPKWN
jgi:hypothetical protein